MFNGSPEVDLASIGSHKVRTVRGIHLKMGKRGWGGKALETPRENEAFSIHELEAVEGTNLCQAR